MDKKEVELKLKMPIFYWLIKLRFPFIDRRRIVITFADKIYALNILPEDLWEHELTHNEQQKYNRWDATKWWLKYMFSRRFRYNQELEAYRRQYRFALIRYSSHQAQKLLQKIAGDLSGSIYGRIVSFSKALKEIQKNEK